MFRSKIIKKRTKNRETLLRNLRKGKARLEARCAFESIPAPTKFNYNSKLHHLYGDVVLMEHEGNMITEYSMINNFKSFKNVQIVDKQGEKFIKVLAENKYVEPADWREIVQRLEHDENPEMHNWAESIKNYSQRYELLVKQLNEQDERSFSVYKEMNSQTEKLRQNLFKSYPCVEMKSVFKYGVFQQTEVVYNEKIVTELGYTMETFSTAVFQEGLPKLISFGDCNSMAAKARLDNFLNLSKETYQSQQAEACVLMKGGYTKKVKLQVYYQPTFEKGVLGYTIICPILARQKPFVDCSKIGENRISTSFIQTMSQYEQEMADFLANFYDKKAERRYTNFEKVCKIKEVVEPME